MFLRTDDTEKSFRGLKKSMVSPPVLSYPDFDKTFLLDTDASKLGVAAILAEKGDVWKGPPHSVHYPYLD